MHYVYIIISESFPGQKYIGRTQDFRSRVEKHNNGASLHTAKFRPWKLDAYCAFSEKTKAIRFERYLKSGSGRAFAKRHF